MKVTPSEVLTAAAQHMIDRELEYDAPGGERSMEKVVDMFNALMGGDRWLTTEQGWMFMALLKIVRSQQGNFRLDNYQDLAAYAALAAEEAAATRGLEGPQPGEVVLTDRNGFPR